MYLLTHDKMPCRISDGPQEEKEDAPAEPEYNKYDDEAWGNDDLRRTLIDIATTRIEGDS